MAPVSGSLKIRVRRKLFSAVDGRTENLVLSNVALDIQAGSFVVLTGPSGCGKSTLLNIIAGLDRDFEGEIDFGPATPNLTYIFQNPRLLPWRTVLENVALALPDGDPRIADIPDLLASVGLSEAANAYPERISLGMQRRAALVRGFVVAPDILLMDEPFVSLDDPTAQALRELLLDLWVRRPTTVIFVTHDRTEAVALGTRILRMASGSASIVQDEAVKLSTEQRKEPAFVQAEQRRIFGVS